MKYEVVEKATGAKMSRSASGMMGTTLFDSPKEATEWMKKVELTDKTHHILEAK